MFDLVIQNGLIVTPQLTSRNDIGIVDGKIAAVGKIDRTKAREIYNADGKYVFPGFIDEHVHSRDPGLTDKEDFAHSTMSAAAGGVTTILEMPNSIPPVKDVESFDLRVRELKSKAYVDYGLWGMVLGDLNQKDLPGLAKAGVVGFKLFWGYGLNKKTLALIYNFSSADDVMMPPDEGEIYDAFRVIEQLKKPLAIHAENSYIITRLTLQERASGHIDYASFLRSRPPFSEAITIQNGIMLAKATGVHLHIVHVSSSEGLECIKSARAEGLPITGETCPHYLVLSDEDYSRLNGNMKVYPPIREKYHQNKLWEGIQSGVIQTIGSDHAPHEEKEKKGDIWTVPAGACGVQTLVPLMLHAASQGKITLNQVAALLSENPARIWGLYGQKGALSKGSDADITIVDMNVIRKLSNEELFSKNKINPFVGMEIQGAPIASFLRGIQVMEDGKAITGPIGQLIKPSTSCQSNW
ncbi:allantoinase AllB [Sulfoacidibacillus ferrooxidans]|nr:allantoinase AllB [Sulfoacidibacillus ferrooxidans]